MEKLYSIIKRFQSLKEKTGTNKSSSYQVVILFSPWDDTVTVKLGGYDVGDWSRHEYLYTDLENLLVDLDHKVSEAERIVQEDMDYDQ